MSAFKKFVWASIALFAVLSISLSQAIAKDVRTGEITWSTDLKMSIEEAKKENKLVLADMYTDWCVFCKLLDKKTFSDSHFGAFANKQFICVKVNAEDNGEGSREARMNGVGSFPIALVYNGEGKVIGKVDGFKDAKSYQAALTDVLKKAGK